MKSEIKNAILIFLPTILAGINPLGVKVLTAFIFIDIATGVISTVRVDGWDKLSSRSFSFGIVFKMFMVLIPLLVAWTGKGVGIDLTSMAVWALNLLIVSEALSILGNIQQIKTGEAIAEVDAVKLISDRIKKVLESLTTSR
jgi:phage-related holin